MKRESMDFEVNRKQNYTTIFGLISKSFISFILIVGLGWLILLAFMSMKILFKSSNIIEGEIVSLKSQNIQFINNSYDSHFHNLISYLLKVEKYLKTKAKIIAEYIDNSFYLKNKGMNNKIITCIALLLGVTTIIIERIIIFLMSIPLFTVTLFLLIVDGLVQRDIRKFQGARESTFFFHRIKPVSTSLFMFLLLVYLAVPVAINPLYFLIPMIIIISLFTMLAIKNYKKYA